MKKYFKNFILCGEIDFHCLLCQESFTDVDNVEKHIRWEKHRKLIKNQNLFSKFKKDRIYKVGTCNYCELCNHVLETVEAVSTHIQLEDHKTRKADPEKEITKTTIVKWDGLKVIIDGKVIVGIEEWHGIVKKHCLFCDVPVKDVDDHVPTTSHMIKLLATVTEYDGDAYFKKVNPDMTYCYECKKIYKNENFPDHVKKTHSELAKAMILMDENKELFEVDEEKQLATCKVCKQTLACTVTVLFNHKKSHLGGTCDDVPEVSISSQPKQFIYVDHGKLRAELKEYGKDNYIKLNSGGSKGYCSLCNKYMSAHINNFKEHIKGLCHKSHLELKGLIKKTGRPEKFKYKTRPLKQFLTDVYYVKDTGSVLLNNDISIDMLSFLFLLPLYDIDKFKCFICDITFPIGRNNHYAKGSAHADKFVKAEVVTTLKDDFIREIKPGLFHCGFCNQVYPNYKLVTKHLDTWNHTFAKSESKKSYDKALEARFYDAQDQYREFLKLLDIMK